MIDPRRSRTLLLAFCPAAIAMAAPDAFGIVRRDDVADQVYLDAALDSAYDAVGRIFTNEGQCSATLVAPNYILTAAHCFGPPGVTPSAASFEIETLGGMQTIDLTGSTVHIHPEWTGSFGTGLDLALIELAAPITVVDPLLLSFSDRGSFIGQNAVHVGFGREGTGLTGALPGTEGDKRAGENRIDILASVTGGDRLYLTTDFDQPLNNVLNQALPTEYSAASGDSGGPLIVTDFFGDSRIAAVSSYISASDGVTDGDYGDTSGYTAIDDGLDFLFPFLAGQAEGVFFGDADTNGVVNLADFDALAQSFGMIDAGWADGDFNSDGVVDLIDFDLLAQNFGASAFSPASVAALPEPATAGLLALAGAAALARRRRR
ncbi:MAG: trypsin-like serine protease [Planctomycetota bacterium]